MINYLALILLLVPELYAMDSASNRALAASNIDRALPQAIRELDIDRVQTILSSRGSLSQAELDYYSHLACTSAGKFRVNQEQFSLASGWSQIMANIFGSISIGAWFLTRKLDGQSPWYSSLDKNRAFKTSLVFAIPATAVTLTTFGLYRYCLHYNQKSYAIRTILNKFKN